MYFRHLSLILTVIGYSNPSAAQVVLDGTDDESSPHHGCKLLLKSRIKPQEKLVGEKYAETHPNSHYKVSNEAGATAAVCNNGSAAGYPCDSVDLLSMMDTQDLSNNLSGSNNELNDIWGWTHSNREFALVGSEAGVAFVEITDPVNPVHLGGLNSATSSSPWRDIKTIGNYAVIGSEASSHGLQIFDLTQLLSVSSPTTFSATRRFTGFGNSHNLFVHEDKGFVYAIGSNQCSGGLYIVDMNDPLNPSQAGCYSGDGYTHDVQCVTYDGPDNEFTGREICFASNEDTITIVDVTNKNNINLLSRTSYSNTGYTHQGWLTEDHAHFIFNDELDELFGMASKTSTHVMNVSNLRNPTYSGRHLGRTNAIDHNLYVKGDYVYQANYRAGFNVLKIQNINSASFDEVGYFDVFPSSDTSSFNGAWSTYPFFPSGNVVVSGIEQGLFVLKFNDGGGSPPNPPTPPPPTPNPPTAPPPTPTSDDFFDDDFFGMDDSFNSTDDYYNCEDGEEFLEKYNRNRNKMVVRECSWLEARPQKIQKYCTTKWRYHKDRSSGVVYKPPHDACPRLCHFCWECNEEPKFKFFWKKKNKKSILKNCKWLSKQKASKRNNICSSKSTDNIYPSADVICPQTCETNSCGGYYYY